MTVQQAMGPFELEGMTPSFKGVGAVVRIRAARDVFDYLSSQGALNGDLDWDNLFPLAREAWVEALANQYGIAHRKASAAAMEELRAYEALALTLPCRSCSAEPGELCRDKRCKVPVYNRHVHQERLDDYAREADS